MKIKFFLVTACILSASIASAQSVEEIMRLSSSTGEYSTSRVLSMGGAFTSLGSDPGSIDINPAGLGMYRSGEFSFTLGLNNSGVTSNSFDGGSVISNKVNSSKFSLANMAAIFNVPVYRSGAVKSITFGISYNRSADFNMKSFSESAPSGTSVSDFFASQLNELNAAPANITGSKNDPMAVYMGYDPDLWGAIMNYNNGMIGFTNPQPPYGYGTSGQSLAQGDRVVPTQDIHRWGQTNNFTFSMGLNVKDWLYLGMSLGGRSFSFNQSVLYQEWAMQSNTGDFNELFYDRQTKQSGSAFDFKIGATIQPTTGLRIGLAYHAPKVTLIHEEYYEYQDVSYLGDNKLYEQRTPFALNDYKVVSSQKLLAGISYRLGSIGILSFDYRLNLNGSVKVKDTGGANALTEVIKNTIRKNNGEYRLGLEINAYRGLFVRGGFGYIESYYNYADKADKKYGAVRNLSAGIGYKARSFYIDMAYQNSRTLVEPYLYFPDAESVVDQKIVNNVVTLTLGFRF